MIAVPGVYRFLAREEETAEKTKLKKSLQQKLELREKGMVSLVEKAEAEGHDKDRGFVVGSGERRGEDDGGGASSSSAAAAGEGGKQKAGGRGSKGGGRTAEAAGVPMAGRGRGGRARSPFLGRYAAIQKRTAVAAVLDFTDEEWESLKVLREADGAATTMTTVDDREQDDRGHN